MHLFLLFSFFTTSPLVDNYIGHAASPNSSEHPSSSRIQPKCISNCRTGPALPHIFSFFLPFSPFLALCIITHALCLILLFVSLSYLSFRCPVMLVVGDNAPAEEGVVRVSFIFLFFPAFLLLTLSFLLYRHTFGFKSLFCSH